MTIFIFTLAMFIFSASCLVWINRRRFYRRNVAGLEGFNSYSGMVVTVLFEGILRIIALLFFLMSSVLLFGQLLQMLDR